MKILANDGISQAGIDALEKEGFTVVTENVPQDQLIEAINTEGYIALLVRSATTVRKDLIDACPGLKLIGRGGVGMDNIDVDYARSIGRHVINTPGASSQSVAELVMAHLFSISRSVFHSNRVMPVDGENNFKTYKKAYAKGQELRGKTIGIIGFGRIGQSLASYCLGAGMTIKAVDLFTDAADIPVPIQGHGTVQVTIPATKDMHAVLGDCDYISLHVPKQADGSAVIQAKEFQAMKDGVMIVNAARGGVIDESDLLVALESGKVRAAALDVFDNEPSPRKELLADEKIATTPHIGAATTEAQERIGLELAEQITALLKTAVA